MKRLLPVSFFLAGFAVLAGCQQKPASDAAAPATTAAPQALTPAQLTEMANAVPSSGPREGNNYQVFFLVLRQDQRPAANFPIDVWVKGKSEKKTIRTNEQGLATASDLPFPGMKNPLEAVFRYYSGSEDQSREITYPFVEGDAYRLKDVQYIPNMVTPEPAQPA